MILVGEQLTQSTTEPMAAPTFKYPDAAGKLQGLKTMTQHVVNFGPSDPQPNGPGTPYQWESLDTRVKWMRDARDANGQPLPWGLIACGAPKWMCAGRVQYEILPENHQAFADFIHAVMLRYAPYGIEHVIVWNEMKGFWDGAKNRWNYEAYTDLYNRVYPAIKSVDPRIKVGGPYPELGAEGGATRTGDLTGVFGHIDHRALDVIDYWLANMVGGADMVGADFVIFDGHAAQKASGAIVGSSRETTTHDYWKALANYVKARTNLPVRVAELHVGQRSPAPDLTPAQSAAMYTAALNGLWDAGNCEAVYTWGNRSGSGIDSDGLVTGHPPVPTTAGKALIKWIGDHAGGVTPPPPPPDPTIAELQAEIARLNAVVASDAATADALRTTIATLNAKIEAGRLALA